MVRQRMLKCASVRLCHGTTSSYLGAGPGRARFKIDGTKKFISSSFRLFMMFSYDGVLINEITGKDM